MSTHDNVTLMMQESGCIVRQNCGTFIPRPTDAERLDWLESMHTLHGVVEILYVVDGYQLTLTYDDSQIGELVHGATLNEAIDNAIAAGWKPMTRGGAR